MSIPVHGLTIVIIAIPVLQRRFHPIQTQATFVDVVDATIYALHQLRQAIVRVYLEEITVDYLTITNASQFAPVN